MANPLPIHLLVAVAREASTRHSAWESGGNDTPPAGACLSPGSNLVSDRGLRPLGIRCCGLVASYGSWLRPRGRAVCFDFDFCNLVKVWLEAGLHMIHVIRCISPAKSSRMTGSSSAGHSKQDIHSTVLLDTMVEIDGNS